MFSTHNELERRLKDVVHGDHVCMIYDTPAEQLTAVIPYLLQGLSAGERCCYIADDGTVDRTLAALEKSGVDVRREQQRGALHVLTKQDAYFQQGAFQPEEMVALLARSTEEASRQGFSGFRATGEMSWALGSEIGCERFIEYEHLLNQFLPGSRATGLCQYNRQRFRPELIRDVLRSHPQAVVGNLVCPNLFYEPPEFLREGGHEADRVEWMLGQLRRNEQAFQDLRRVEERLRQSEQRYRSVVETVPDCVKLVNAEGTLLQMNRAGLEIIESDSRALGQSVYGVIAEEDRKRFQEFNQQVCQGQGGTLEFDVIGLNGTRKHLETTAVPLAEPLGGYLHLAITRDVSARRHAERKRDRQHAVVENERQRLAEVFQWAPSFMAVLRGPEFIFERANTRYQELVGDRELIGKSVREALPEIVDQGFLEILNQVYHSGQPYVGSDARVMLQRGRGELEEVFLEFVYQPMRDAEGLVTGVIVQGIDLTERRRAELALARVTADSARMERLYETVLSNTPDLVYVFDLQHRFTYANEALLRMWGRSWDDSIGRTCLELGYEPWHAAMHGREIDQVVATQRPIRGEVPFTGTNGRRIYDYIFVPVFNGEGQVEAVAGTTRDVTERRRMEDELRESDRKKDDFLALLAHELRNPLAPLRNGLQVMRLASSNSEAVAKVRAMMDRQLSHMVRLIDDLLDISRISRNKMELRCTRLELSDVLESAVETARPMIDEAGHQLRMSLPTQPVILNADLTRLAQVFSNLLTNSAKYTPQGGHIWVTAEHLGNTVTVSVQDDGIGIPLEAQATIFDMFSQVDPPNGSRSAGGLGIGLALVKGLTEMHGGTVSITSAGAGMGSQFRVELPCLGDSPAAPALSDTSPAADWNRLRVMVVDDSQDGAESLAIMLQLLGHDVVTAHNGLQAIQRAEEFRPELILMDIGMPGMSGLEATQQIRQHAWGTGMQIFALTGWGQEQDRQQSVRAGCNGHLVKPVDFAQLQELLLQFVR